MTATTPAEAEVKDGAPAPVDTPAPEEAKDDAAQQAPAVPADSNLTHVVLRPFHGSGCLRVAGEVVDASAWRGAKRLCETRYLRPLLAGDPTPVGDGERFFIDDDSLLAYIDAMPATETEED